MNNKVPYSDLVRLAGRHFGGFDVPCPICGPLRKAAGNQRRRVFRIWRITPTYATYRCARCDVQGYARADGAAAPDPVELAKAKAEAQRFAATTAETKRSRARWLWGQRRSISGTPAERYLRDARRYGGLIPSTIGFLPARGDHSPAMISAFGMPLELEPNVISISTTAVMAVHLTRLAPDGSAKAGTDADKIMIGSPRGAPIALAAVGDLLGLAITEGIEDALSVHEATGLGVWAAGSAAFMPGLAAVIPSYVDCTTIVADPDPDGERFATELKVRLADRHLDHRMIVWGSRGGRIAA